jgi:hypothetical protein
LNYPGLTSATATTSSTAIEGNLNTVPNKNIAIDFYRSPAADPSGFGEGKVYIGSKTVTTDANGNVLFIADFPGDFTNEFFAQYVTATATAFGLGTAATSEFGNAVPAETFFTGTLDSNRTALNPQPSPRIASR